VAAGLLLAIAACVITPIGTAHAAGPWQSAVELPGTAALNVGGDAAADSESCASTGNCSAGGTYRDASGYQQAFLANEVNGVWQNAVEVPGTAALNASGNAAVNSVSCASAGNCAAGGKYADASGHGQAFVANEVNGVWQNAVEVPGTAALNASGNAAVNTLSCVSAGNCAAGGKYTDAAGHQQAFVAGEVNGVWQDAAELPGTAALNAGGWANIASTSCASAGSCSAGGIYTDAAGHGQAFVASEVNGTWQNALEVPGTAALNVGGSAGILSVSCASAGNCSVGGSYYDVSKYGQAFVANEINGTWQSAVEVPGTAALNAGGFANVFSVACPTAGYCSAGGSYYDASGYQQAFVVSEVNGVWQTAVEVPGTAALNASGYAEVNSVSCNSVGTCTAGGGYDDASNHDQAFVVNEVNGTWQSAVEVPGTATLNAAGNAAVSSVSCASDGYCDAVGAYTDAAGHQQAFAVGTPTGVWQNAVEVPGIASLNLDGYAQVTSVSCPSAGNCGAGGGYRDASGHDQVFVVNEANGTWQSAVEVPGTATLNAAGSASLDSVSCASAGYCSAVGTYSNASGKYQAFVANKVNGTWQSAVEVPGTATLNTDGNANALSVSCSLASNCATVGYYTDASGHGQAFVASEVRGIWQSAVELPGTAALNAGGWAQANWVSCAAAGNCSVGGSYTDASGHEQAFVASEVNSTWQSAVEVPGSAALNAGGYAGIESVSCGSPGNCSAGGYYTDASGHDQALIANEVSGSWQSAVEVPGTAALAPGGADAYSVSCASAGNCSVVGTYTDASGHSQVYAANEVGGTWQNAAELPGTAALNAYGRAQVNSVSCASAGNCSAGGTYADASDAGQAFVVNEVNGTWQNAEEVPGTAALNTDGNASVLSISCGAAGNCGAGGYYGYGAALDQAFVVNSI
jgi:hypothetical protein